MLTQEAHRALHKEWHRVLDALSADFILVTGRRPSETSLLEVLKWSYQQTIEPETGEEAIGEQD